MSRKQFMGGCNFHALFSHCGSMLDKEKELNSKQTVQHSYFTDAVLRFDLSERSKIEMVSKAQNYLHIVFLLNYIFQNPTSCVMSVVSLWNSNTMKVWDLLHWSWEIQLGWNQVLTYCMDAPLYIQHLRQSFMPSRILIWWASLSTVELHYSRIRYSRKFHYCRQLCSDRIFSKYIIMLHSFGIKPRSQ